MTFDRERAYEVGREGFRSGGPQNREKWRGEKVEESFADYTDHFKEDEDCLHKQGSTDSRERSFFQVCLGAEM